MNRMGQALLPMLAMPPAAPADDGMLAPFVADYDVHYGSIAAAPGLQDTAWGRCLRCAAA